MPARPAPTTTTSCRTMTPPSNVPRPAASAAYQGRREAAASGACDTAAQSRTIARLGYPGEGRGRPRVVVTPGRNLGEDGLSTAGGAPVLRGLTQAELHELAAKQATARATAYGAVNVQTEVLARSKALHVHRLRRPRRRAAPGHRPRRVGARVGRCRTPTSPTRRWSSGRLIGNDPEHRVPARLLSRAATSNIAGMQHVLYFHDPDDGEGLRAGADRHLHAQPGRCPAIRTTG